MGVKNLLLIMCYFEQALLTKSENGCLMEVAIGAIVESEALPSSILPTLTDHSTKHDCIAESPALGGVKMMKDCTVITVNF